MMRNTRLRAFQRTFERAFCTCHAASRIPSQTRAIRAFSIPALHKFTPTLRSNASQRRLHSSDSSEAPRPLTERDDTSQEDADAIATRKALSPAYQLWFTCKKCLERSGHTVSKQAYHFGTCVINCPKCKSQHLISDHLKIFGDGKMTLEDIAREHGEKLRKGRLGLDGDVEFYDEKADEVIRGEEERKERLGKSASRAEPESAEEREEREMTERIRDNMRG